MLISNTSVEPSISVATKVNGFPSSADQQNAHQRRLEETLVIDSAQFESISMTIDPVHQLFSLTSHGANCQGLDACIVAFTTEGKRSSLSCHH